MINTDVEIIKIDLNDLSLLQHISIQTFTETFALHNTQSDMDKYIAENLSKERLRHELATEGSEFYFIRSSEEIAGYLKVNCGNAQTELKTPAALEIERIYVLQKHHGKKIGLLLLNKAIAIAGHKQCPYIWLGVWEKNTRAIAFYKKHGFVEFDRHIFRLGNDDQLDFLMKLELNQDAN